MRRHPRWWGVLLVLATVLAAAAVGPARAHARTHSAASPKTKPNAHAAQQRRNVADRAVRAARSRIGSPYSWGGVGPGAFDCSGLTLWSMRRAGITLPRTSFAQASIGNRIARHNVRAGDLVFFNTAGPGASHVGIATGPRTVISATSHGVRSHSFRDGYWGGYYVGARRVAELQTRA